jgi:Domain of unknown function DUF29
VQNNRRLFEISLRGARREMRDLLAESPGLKPSADELFKAAWRIGRDGTLKFIDLPDDAIAEAPLWTFEQAMDDNFVPAN